MSLKQISMIIVICLAMGCITFDNTTSDNTANSPGFLVTSDYEIEWINQVDHSIPTPELDQIDILFNDLIENNVANKSHYSKLGGSKDVHICGNMACEQAEWIKDNYGYETGVVILWSKRQEVGHGQTWVVIDNERYVFESTNNEYWTESDHNEQFSESYKICFVSTKKGREHTKASAEYCRTG